MISVLNINSRVDFELLKLFNAVCLLIYISVNCTLEVIVLLNTTIMFGIKPPSRRLLFSYSLLVSALVADY